MLGTLQLASYLFRMTNVLTIGEYERGGSAKYDKLAATVASILDAAIEADPELHCQPAQHRAKGVASLRRKMEARGLAEDTDLTQGIKDLAGCRLVFYSNTDVGRFRNSNIIRANFEVDWARTRIHYPGTDPEPLDNQFIGDNYVVRLKADRTGLPEYADLAGLWCEVQIQTILNHAWSAMAHDTIYKRPDLRGIGDGQMKKISARMTKIMREYLLPAGFEFQKVLSDFDRLASGKRLLESRILDAAIAAPNNNERFDLTEQFERDVLPLYDNFAEVYPQVRGDLLRAAAVAQETFTTEVGTELGAYRRSAEAVVSRIAQILLKLRYVDLEATFDALAELYLGSPVEERGHLVKAVGELARHDLTVWQKHGAVVQAVLLDRIDALDPGHRDLLRPLISEVHRQVILPEISGTSSTSSTVTISSGGVVPSDALRQLRSRSLLALFAQYEAAQTPDEADEIIAAIKAATQFPMRGGPSDELRIMIASDSTKAVQFLTQRVERQSLETRRKLEHDLFFLHRRSESAVENSNNEDLERSLVELDAAIDCYRAKVNALTEYVRYKTIVGWHSVFEPEWRMALKGGRRRKLIG